jgi:peptide/nickel transport system permease protein
MARSVAIAAAAWLAALGAGAIIGTTGALTEDRLAGRAIEGAIAVAYTTPLLLVLVGVMSLVGRDTGTAYLIVAMVAWAPVARHTRAIVRETLAARFVSAACEMGFGRAELTWYVLLPAVYRPVLAASLPLLPELIAIDAALSFFGFGPPPPQPTIGGMIIEGLQHLGHAPWILTWPVVLLAGTCLMVRLITQSLE